MTNTTPRSIARHRRLAPGRLFHCLAALMLVIAAHPALAAPPPTPGQPAPALTLTAQDGSQVTLAGLRGRPVLVDFWASWCVPCRISVPALDDLYQEFHARGLEVMAINVDEHAKDAHAFLAGRKYTMPIFYDPKGVSPGVAGVEGMPTSFLVGRDGRIRFVHLGYSDKVMESYRREIELLLSEPSPDASRSGQ